jgi:hypothetical protein
MLWIFDIGTAVMDLYKVFTYAYVLFMCFIMNAFKYIYM